jgi:hypothetical protein
MLKKGSSCIAVENYMKLQGISKNSIEEVKRKSEDLYNDIVSTPKFNTGLLLGYVQSGKTNGMLMSMAYAIDNGFNKIILLTANDEGIYNQTVDRLRESKLMVHTITKDKINSTTLLNDAYDKFVAVCPKNAYRLENLREFVISSTDESWLIFDDEADQASLNTNASKSKEEQSTINSNIEFLLTKINTMSYIQVTATPQALLLQNLRSLFRPDFIVTLEPGEGYVGGEKLFLKEDSENNFLRIYNKNDIDISYNTDGMPVIPEAMKDAICNFLLATTIKFIKTEGNSYTCMIHISIKKDEHSDIEHIVNLYMNAITKSLKMVDKKIEDKNSLKVYKDILDRFQKEYNNLKNTVNDIPNFSELINMIKESCRVNNIQVINSDTGKSPNYKSLYNFIIGGTRLSRGLTIKNLITTYYTRDPLIAKIDTMNQHARMYGYRENDLDVIRIFTTSAIARRFAAITRHENELRKAIIDNTIDDPIALYVDENLQPTRNNVLIADELSVFRSGEELFPHRPKYLRKDVENNTNILNDLLDKYIKNNKMSACKVSIDFMLKILEYIETYPYKNQAWDDILVKKILTAFKRIYDNIGYIIVDVNRDLGQNFKRSTLGTINAVLASGEKELVNVNYPTLFLYRIIGKHNVKNWDDTPFWIPDIILPKDKKYLFVTNFESEEI